MRSLFYLLIFLVTAPVAAGQQEKRDSLLKLLSHANEDTSKVYLLLKLADEYEANNQDSSVSYLEQAKKLSEQLHFRTGMFHYFAQSAIVSFTNGKYDLALRQNNEALAVATEIKDSNFIINTLANAGIVCQYLGQFDKQLEYSLQALRLIESKKQTAKLAPMYHNVGNAYYNLLQYRKSIDYCLLGIAYLPQARNNNGNRIYSSLANGYAGLNIIDSALYYHKIALDRSIKADDQYAVGGTYGYMADLYADKHEFREMLAVSEKELQMARKLQSSQMLAAALQDVAYAKYFNGDNAAAKKQIMEALEIAEKDSLMDELKNIYEALSYIAAKDGDFKTSMLARHKSDSIREAILNEQVVKTTAELETKYESEKKDKQIILQQAQIEKKELFNYILTGSAAALLIFIFLLYRYYHQKKSLQQQRINELVTEKQLSATEAVLKGEEQERTRLAKDLHDGLGGMMSGIKYSLQTVKKNLVMTAENQQAFERSMDMLDSSISEMRRVAHNMMPESLVKFGLDTALTDFCNDIDESGVLQVSYQSIGMENSQLDHTTAVTIYRIVQELINNIIRHASATTAIVQLSKRNDVITITVEDDGQGFNPVMLGGSGGMGWKNIQSRIGYLKGKADVQSEPGKGTSVHIELSV